MSRRGALRRASCALVFTILTGCLSSAKTHSNTDGAVTVGDGGVWSGDLAGVVTPDMTTLFEPSPPSVYVTKVKQILTGLPATDSEVAGVVADPTTLPSLIDTWMALPQFEGRMLDFFRNAFQQNHVDLDTMSANYGEGTKFRINSTYAPRLEQSIMDSFGLTAWSMVQAGQPFNTTLTTDTYMLTTAQLVILSFYDDIQVNDTGSSSNRLQTNNVVNANIVLDPASTNTLTQSLDSTNSATYMIWPATPPTKCNTTAQTFSTASKYATLFQYLFGFSVCVDKTTAANDQYTFTPVLTDNDFVDYHAVKIVAATGPTASPSFFDIPAMRAATQIALHTPRIGFAGTLAFATNWGTNAGNEARVTANQSLIVGIGQSIDGQSQTITFPENSGDLDHASATACASCHMQLDPFKQYFRQSWTLDYHDQLDTTQINAPAGFSIDGVTVSGGTGIPSVMQTLATHPRFQLAWAQKLYFWATSRAADETDPELIHIASDFAMSGYDWKTLVRELFSSPLTTYASPTQTTLATGGLISIGRRDQLCAAITNRLGIADACGLETPKPSSQQAAVNSDATLIATDTYFRAFELPSLPTQPDLFFRASTEAVCGLIALEVVTSDGVSGLYKTSDTTSAIADMVSNVMALPSSDPRAAQASQILTQHLMDATAVTGASAVDALRSTFMLACQAPSSVIVGL